VAPIVQRILASNTRTVICSHRPVIPDIFATAGVAEIGLAPASMVVLHRRQGKVLDLEQHD
jgi:8-oxo-dGTP diphosphatase